MINGPRVTDNGLEVSSLLRPEFVVNGLVRIDSIFDEYDGDYKIVAIEDDGDTHGDQWGSRLTCVNGKFKAAKKMKEKK
jgi:hypothetical protein